MITKQGTVTKISGTNTIRVEVHHYENHPIYKKRYRITKNFLAHDPEGKAQVGDAVSIQQCRPISKRKSWILTDITK